MIESIVFFVISISVCDASGSFGFDTNLSARLKPQDYLFAPSSETSNDLFDKLKPVEAGVDLAIGADCGKINIEGTLKSTFGKVLDGNYFKGLASDILGSAPMLAACYMSPTWCSILKHTQISANFLTQTRLNQCQIIDKYVDSRTEDYYRERQNCMRRSIETSGGDMDSALASCQQNVFENKAGNWAGQSQGDPNRPNELLADSVRWAGFEGDEGKRITDLLKSMVGDSVISNGNYRVEYGSRAHAYSPRSHLIATEKQISDGICGKLLPEISNLAQSSRYMNDDEIVRRIQLLTGTKADRDAPVLTPDLVRNLSHLAPGRRDRVCIKLSQAIAMQSFTRDMNRSLDILTVAAQNPNLPPNRKAEIDSKRVALKDQVDLTLRLRQEQAKPMGEVMQYIVHEGLAAQDEATRENLGNESSIHSRASHAARMNDCADGVFCNE